MSRDAQVDAYIADAAEFARPILERIREGVHAACPEAEEAIKWRMPNFLYRGKIIAGMAAFKAHAALAFWRAAERTATKPEAMGQYGRLTRVEDLPPRAELEALVHRAMATIDAGEPARPKKAPKPDLPAPDDLRAALDAEPKAAATFEAFPRSCRRDYVEWVTEAKRPETRAKRIADAVAWMAEGKRRNWKYEGC